MPFYSLCQYIQCLVGVFILGRMVSIVFGGSTAPIRILARDSWPLKLLGGTCECMYYRGRTPHLQVFLATTNTLFLNLAERVNKVFNVTTNCNDVCKLLENKKGVMKQQWNDGELAVCVGGKYYPAESFQEVYQMMNALSMIPEVHPMLDKSKISSRYVS